MSDLTQGQVQWHCSEEEGGPDVGIAIGLGGNRQLWIGELLDQDGGWWGLAMYEPEKRLIDMKDYNEVRELFEDVIAPLMQDRSADRIAELEARVGVLTEALETIRWESQRSNGRLCHLRMCVAAQARAALCPSARSE